jgi:hypothetical protein
LEHLYPTGNPGRIFAQQQWEKQTEALLEVADEQTGFSDDVPHH